MASNRAARTFDAMLNRLRRNVNLDEDFGFMERGPRFEGFDNPEFFTVAGTEEFQRDGNETGTGQQSNGKDVENIEIPSSISLDNYRNNDNLAQADRFFEETPADELPEVLMDDSSTIEEIQMDEIPSVDEIEMDEDEVFDAADESVMKDVATAADEIEMEELPNVEGEASFDFVEVEDSSKEEEILPSERSPSIVSIGASGYQAIAMLGAGTGTVFPTYAVAIQKAGVDIAVGEIDSSENAMETANAAEENKGVDGLIRYDENFDYNEAFTLDGNTGGKGFPQNETVPETDENLVLKMEKTTLCDTEPTFFLNKVKFYPAFAIANFLGIIIQYVFNALSSTGPDGTLFKNSTGDLSDKYSTSITPAGWTFSIWGFIYAWQASWVVFTLVNICRKAPTGEAAHKNPPYIPNTIFITQFFISALNIIWLITFDREEIEVALTTLIVYTLLQYLLLTISVRALDKCSPTLVQQNRTMDIWLTRGLLLNGIGIQLAWVNIATLLNLQMVLIYSSEEVLCSDQAGTLALSILTVHVVVLPFIDMFFLDVYTRYLITPYLVVIIALAGSISKNWDEAKTNSIFSAVLISYACGLCCFKIGLTIYRHLTKPRYTTNCRCKKTMEAI